MNSNNMLNTPAPLPIYIARLIFSVFSVVKTLLSFYYQLAAIYKHLLLSQSAMSD